MNINETEKGITYQTPKSSQAPSRFFGQSFCADPERTLDKIDEDPSHENSTFIANEQYDLESCTGTSNRTYGHMKIQGLTGKSTEFKTGDLRNKNLRLNYIDPFFNNQCLMERPQNSGNERNDRIGLFAYSHGVDPRIFIERDNRQAQKSIEQLKKYLTPRQPPNIVRF